MIAAYISGLTLLVLAEEGGFHLPSWLNYPGFEAWKFFNLFLFAGVLFFLLRRPIGEAMRVRREGIRYELKRA